MRFYIVNMNKSEIKSVPPGNFEEISFYIDDWQAKFKLFATQKQHIKYDRFNMPDIPQEIQDELNNGRYVCHFLASDYDQQFLIPK